MRVHVENKLELFRFRVKMPDFSWAGGAQLFADTFPFPAIEEVSFSVVGCRNFDPVVRNRGLERRVTGRSV
jgi:hypothetical protein